MTVLPVERHTQMPHTRFYADPRDPDRDLEAWSLAALPNAAGTARRFVVAQIRKWGLDHLGGLADNCELVASELVTNAVTATGSQVAPEGYVDLHDHTPAVIIVRLRLTERRLLCEVWDPDPAPPVPSALTAPVGPLDGSSPPDDSGLLCEGGRGLLLVAAHATDWGSYPSPNGHGKVVLAWWDLSAASVAAG